MAAGWFAAQPRTNSTRATSRPLELVMVLLLGQTQPCRSSIALPLARMTRMDSKPSLKRPVDIAPLKNCGPQLTKDLDAEIVGQQVPSTGARPVAKSGLDVLAHRR